VLTSAAKRNNSCRYK